MNTINENRTMRRVLAALTKELGTVEGTSVFEWYCRTYKLTIADEAPAAIMSEVFGR